MLRRPRVPMRVRSLIGLTAGVTALLLAAPVASATATDRYVDDSSMGVPPCTSPALPCQSIAQALSAPAVPGDVIHVGGGSYPGGVTLPDGVSLIRDSFMSPFDTSGVAVI